MNVKPFLASMLIFLGAATFSAQTTAFSHQGKLTVESAPANGSYDFEFKLFDAVSAGTQQGSTEQRLGVVVVNGIFSVSLDFGAGALSGADRFLEVAVRAAGGGAFSVLAPRQKLLSAPFAVKSINATTATTATTATNATNATNATTATNATQLGGQPATFYQNAANLSSGTLDALRLPIPLTLSGASATHIIRGENATFDPEASGVLGLSTAATGTASGVRGQSSSIDGRGVYGVSTAATGTTFGVFGVSDSIDGRGVYGLAGAGSGFTYGVYGRSQSTSGVAVHGWASGATGLTTGVWGLSDSPSGRGVLGWARAGSGTTNGVMGQSDSPSGRGVFGQATAATGITFGGYFESASTDGRGVYGVATGTTGINYGVYGQSSSLGGRGVFGQATAATGPTYGGRFESNSTDGIGVFGRAPAATGFTYGGRFESASTNGVGVFGWAAVGTGSTYGGYFESSSTSGRGVFAWASGATGTNYGVYGQSNSLSGFGGFFTSPGVGLQAQSSGNDAMYATTNAASRSGLYAFHSATTGTNYGVFGRSDSSTGYGLWAQGNTGASGTKSFRIDHPDDPENKYLVHYSMESPEVLNAYRGTVVLNGQGEATVELPSYFAKINRSPSYQLTAVGAPMPMLYVAEEIDEAALTAGAKAGPGEAAPKCTFRIAGGVPGAKVSWRVEAVRNDKWMQQSRPPVEVEKEGTEKGTYQHPELYGQPKEKGMNYDATRERKEVKNERKEIQDPDRRP